MTRMLTRADLHALVWDRPMTTLAANTAFRTSPLTKRWRSQTCGAGLETALEAQQLFGDDEDDAEIL